MSQTSRISGWGRVATLIGIVLSCAWIVVMLVRGSEHMHAQRIAIADGSKKSFERNKEKGVECFRVWFRTYIEAEQRDRDRPVLLNPGVFEAFLPVLAGWLIAFGFILAIRWVA